MPNELIVFALLTIIFFIIIQKLKGKGGSSLRERNKTPEKDGPWSRSEPVRKPIVRQAESGQKVAGAAYVIDGDTIDVKGVRIRLFGIDAPEIDHPYGQKSKRALIKLCKGQRVIAEILENDHYDRTVARCFLSDGRDLSAELVKQGLALDWKKYSGGAYARFEPANIRRKLFRTAARQKGHMKLWAGEYSKRPVDEKN